MALEAAQEADREEAEHLQAEENRLAAEAGPAPGLPAETDDARDAELQDHLLEAAARAPRQHARHQPQLDGVADDMARLAVGPAPAQARGGARRPRGQNRAARPVPAHNRQQQQQQLDPAHEAAFRRFVEMAARDEEDGWNSDELEDDDMWVIRAR